MAPINDPGAGTKVFFWFILAAYSVFFAEVLSGSFLFPFFDVLGYLVLLPLYGLHAMVLFTLAVRWGRRSFATLFSVGLLFGLYEAFITKEILSPQSGLSPLFFLEVDWLQYTVLVLWWHMFMAFIIPVLLAVHALTRGNDISVWLPAPARRLLSDRRRSYYVMISFLAWAGAFMGGNTDPVWGPIAAASGLIIIYAISRLWKRRTGNSFTLEQLLPKRSGVYLLLAILVIWCYLIVGSLFGTNGLPGLTGHIVILTVYALSLLLMVLALKVPKEGGDDVGAKVELPELDLKVLALMALVLGVSVSLSSLIGLGRYIIIVSFIGGSLLGSGCLLWVVITVVRRYIRPGSGG